MTSRSALIVLVPALVVVAAVYLDRFLSPPPVQGRQIESIYDFRAVDIKGREVRIRDLAEGKVVLIVNTASRCGFSHVYEDLQRVYEKYGPRGFTVLGELSVAPGPDSRFCNPVVRYEPALHPLRRLSV